MTEFSNKVAIVTGSSSGIGAAVAIALARGGAKVTIHGRNVAALAEVGAKIKETSGQDAVQVIGDMLNEATPEKIVDATVEKFGQVDILVNNAGLMTLDDNVDSPDYLKMYDRVMGVNLRSLVAMTYRAVPHLAKTRGNIVNISSIAAHIPFSPIYGVSKIGVDMFTKCMANQLAPKHIRVNCVNPGPVETKLTRDFVGVPEEKNYNKWSYPSHCNAQGEDIAHLVLFLANDRVARNMTGSIVVNDSGVSIDPISMAKFQTVL